MVIGIISDSHDNMPNIYKALEYFKQQGITTLIHCGDVCAPGVMREIAQKFGGTMHLVYGNVDGDREKMETLPEGSRGNGNDRTVRRRVLRPRPQALGKADW